METQIKTKILEIRYDWTPREWDHNPIKIFEKNGDNENEQRMQEISCAGHSFPLYM